jgi:membrane-bound ClpP family serine protease
MTDEVLYYSDDKGIKITNKQAIFGKKSYELRSINSIRVTKNPKNPKIPILLVVFGTIFIIIDTVRFHIFELFIGIFSFVFGIIDLLAKPTYMIKLLHTKGEYVPILSRDKERIE